MTMLEERPVNFSGVLSSSSIVSTFGMPSEARATGNEARQRFHVDISESNNVVSWKKLLQTMPATSANAPAGANPALEAWLSPQMTQVNSLQVEKLPPPSNRFSSVIEKIEKLYQGNDSDEENIHEMPDDDQYNTDDSFIDDTELDEYFLVDKTKMKHRGFFINRGNLEKISDEEIPMIPTKRKSHKDFKKLSVKNLKAGSQKTGASRPAVRFLLPSSAGHEGAHVGKSQFYNPGKSSKQLNVQMENLNKTYRSDLRAPHGSPSNIESMQNRVENHGHFSKSADKIAKGSQQLPGKNKMGSSKKLFQQKIEGTAVTGMVPSWPKKQLTNHAEDSISGETGSSKVEVNVFLTEQFRQRDIRTASPVKVEILQNVLIGAEFEEKDVRERAPASKENLELAPSQKDGSVVKRLALPKKTILEKAVHDLEQEIRKSCPPNFEGQEAEKLSQLGLKPKRLPRDVKQKLAKVARIAGKQGKIPKCLTDRLMRILGHVMQLKTLKKNLKEMVDMGLSVQREKEGRLQDIKREVVELVKSRVFLLQGQEIAQGESSAVNFQLTRRSSDKWNNIEQFKWDHAIEDRLCHLYDQYVEGMDEHKGSNIRRFYLELAELWPAGWMDKTGVKHAVHRAKGRKKRLSKLELQIESTKRRKVGEAPKTIGRNAGGFLAKPSDFTNKVHVPIDYEVRVESHNCQDSLSTLSMYKIKKSKISQGDVKMDWNRLPGQKATIAAKIKSGLSPTKHTVERASSDLFKQMKKKSSQSLLLSPKWSSAGKSLSQHESKNLEHFVLTPSFVKKNVSSSSGSFARHGSEEPTPH